MSRPRPWLILLGLLLAVPLIESETLADEAETLIRHDIDLSLDPDTRRIEIRDSVSLPAGGERTFALAPWLRLEEARIEGRAIELERSGDRVFLPPGTQEIELVMSGQVPALPPPDARRGLSGAMAGAEGSVLPGYAGWLPVFGEDPVRFRLAVTVPEPYRAVAVGRLLEEGQEGAAYRAVFAAEQPSELPSVFIGPYVIKERKAAGLRLRTYFHAELAPLADGYLETAAGMIAGYAEQIGPYPYADFHIISAPLPVGLGYPNLTYVSRKIVPLPFMRGRSLAHEILHNWFGNGIAIDYRSGNWAEGLTTYLADYALAEDPGPEASKEMRLGWLRNLAALPDGQDAPVTSFVSKTHDASQAVGYDKVAGIFHMLRQELGEAAFRSGLRTFWQDMRFRVAGWDDVRQAFEAAAGRKLAWFFDQWLERPGLPQVELAGVEQLAGGAELAVTLRQGKPGYRLRVPLIVETAQGPRQHFVVLDEAEKTITIPLETEALTLHVDPGFDLLRKLLPGESAPILRDVTLAQNAQVFLLTDDEAFAESARRLTGRLLQRDFKEIQLDTDRLPETPLLVIGTTRDVADFRAKWPSDSMVETLKGRGTARVWAARGPEGAPWLFVETDNSDSLGALLRPLPHYRSQSFLVFEGSKAKERGVWPASDSPLNHRFGE